MVYGAFRRGVKGTMIIIPPVKMAEDARPAIARPIINDIEFGAAPQRAEPASKRTIEPRNTDLME
jgi:hypothetical protein